QNYLIMNIAHLLSNVWLQFLNIDWKLIIDKVRARLIKKLMGYNNHLY
ncbi:MAG: hypothetical protein ACI9HU_001748, partial [Colwellia sp.]